MADMTMSGVGRTWLRRAGVRRARAERWGVPVAAVLALAMAVGVSAAFTVNRIEHGTTAVSVTRTVAPTYANGH